MNIQRHPIDIPAIAQRLPRDARLARQLLGLAREDPDRLSMLQNMSYLWGCYQVAADPTSPDVAVAWRISVQAGAALMASAAHEGSEVVVPLGDGPPATLVGGGADSTTHARRWLDTARLALVCRDRESLKILSTTPTSVVRASSTVGDSFVYDHVDLLRAVVDEDPRVGALLITTLEGTDPKQLQIADIDYVLDIVVPELEILTRVLARDTSAFNTALEKALELHRRYWDTEERRSDSEGFIALGPLAMAALGHDRGLTVNVQSDYLPGRFVRREF